MIRRKTRHTGVYERASSSKKYQGKADIAYDFCWRDEAGKLHWKCAGWRSEGMTAAEAADLRREATKGTKARQDTTMTFGQAWAMYQKDWLEAEGKANIKTDIGLYRNHLKRRLALVRMVDMGPKHLKLVLADMAALSPQTRKHAMALVRRVYRKLEAWRIYRGDIPTVGMMPGKLDNGRLRFLTPEEARQLLAELDKRSPTTADICRVSLYAGLRLGEIFGLKVQHIHLEARVLDVMDAKAGTRQAMISQELLPVLAAHIKGRRPAEYVFTQSDGTQLKYINQTYARAVKALGLNDGVEDRRQKVVFHTLRHTFASWLVQKGVPLYTVADLMGHSSIAMTQRYAKLADDDRRQAIEQVAAML